MKPSERIAEILNDLAKKYGGSFKYQEALLEAYLIYLDEEHAKKEKE